ncbi:MAG: hypothetical protein NWE94_05395 [Candidatus Bathyarchaeota archaeon]|nr:hypothetical protein [Candidatus Bathyarchaeota archaeon]
MFVSVIFGFMLTFDVAMPLTLFLVTLAALLLSKRVEGKLKATLEEREFRTVDMVLFSGMVGVVVSVVVFVPQMALIALFMFSYASLLFTFSYLFSAVNKKRAVLLISTFLAASFVVGAVALAGFFSSSFTFYGGIAACGLTVFAFAALLFELKRTGSSGRWYLAVLPPALFVIIFFVFSPTPVWFPFLFDAFGIVFAVLITLYLSTLFTWKTTFIFAVLLTVIDFILVLVIPVMEPAATHVVGLGLPVVIVLPVIPPVFTSAGLFGLQPIALGLGDFFFAGTLATQTYKKLGKKAGVVSALTMSIAFGVFELLLLNTSFGAFPGTLMIIFGWLPVVAWKLFAERKAENSLLK